MDQGVPIVFPQHISDIPFFSRNETVLLCLCFTVSFKKLYAMPLLNTTQSGKLPGTTPPCLMQCFVATVRRNDSETMRTIVFFAKSPSWLFSYCLLDSVVAAVFLRDGRWRRTWRGGRGLRRSQSSGDPRCRIHPTSGQPRSHLQAAPTTPRPVSGTSSRTGPRVPCRTDPHLEFPVVVRAD